MTTEQAQSTGPRLADHIVKSFDHALLVLHQTVLEMGGAVEAQIGAAIEAVNRRDPDEAERVVREDARIDDLERSVDSQVLRLLALRTPVATDLREVLASLRIAADLERAGDYAANVAKRAIVLAQGPVVRPIGSLALLGRQVREQLHAVLDAFAQRDVARAIKVWQDDRDIDNLHTSLFREILTYMMEDARVITAGTHLLFMAKNFERIGDHATNIAETVHFLVEGRPLTETRPKDDRSSVAFVPPPRSREP